jgi:hypothetical protein
VIPATKDRLESFVQLKDSAAKGTRAIKFLDLNRDELIRTPLRASYTGSTGLCWNPAS